MNQEVRITPADLPPGDDRIREGYRQFRVSDERFSALIRLPDELANNPSAECWIRELFSDACAEHDKESP